MLTVVAQIDEGCALSLSDFGPRVLLCLVVSGCFLLPATTSPAQAESPAAAAPVAAYQDTRADEGRTVPAYLPSGSADRVVRVFSTRFWARQGERRSITSRVLARQPSGTPDSLLMASVSVMCSPSGPGVTNAGATQNLIRGRTTVLTPRFVYVVPRTGMVGCTVVASGLRPRPVATGRTSANTWVVGMGSYLAVSEPMAGWTRSWESDARSRVVGRGGRWTPIGTTTRVGADTHFFEVTSDHKVTTCSAVGGSRDATTYGRELCADRVSRRGSLVRAEVATVQLDRRGQPCASPQVFGTRRVVRPDVHHQMVTTHGVVRVSHRSSCTTRFRIRGSLQQLGGADVVIHAPSERVAILHR